MSNENLTPATPVQPVPKKKKKWPWIAGIIAFLIVVASCAGNAGAEDDTVSAPAPSAVSQPATEQAVSPTPQVVVPTVPTVEAPKQVEATAGQKNALKKAESYLSFTAFSASGLAEQLEYNKFTPEDAAWAVAHVKADWNEQAVKKAKSYLEFTAFSHAGLVDQLVYNGFTPEQAEHGATGAGL